MWFAKLTALVLFSVLLSRSSATTWAVRTYHPSSTCSSGDASQYYAYAVSSCSSVRCSYYSTSTYYTQSCIISDAPPVPSGWAGYRTYSSLSSCQTASSIPRSFYAWPSDYPEKPIVCNKFLGQGRSVVCAANTVVYSAWAYSSCTGTTSVYMIPTVAANCSYISGIGYAVGFSSQCGGQLNQTISFPSASTVLEGSAVSYGSFQASSGLPVEISVLTPATCRLLSTSLSFTSPGVCSVRATQAGSSVFRPASDSFSFTVQAPPWLVNTYFDGPCAASTSNITYSTSQRQSSLTCAPSGCYSTSTGYYSSSCVDASPAVGANMVGYRQFVDSCDSWRSSVLFPEKKCVRVGSYYYFVQCSGSQIVILYFRDPACTVSLTSPSFYPITCNTTVSTYSGILGSAVSCAGKLQQVIGPNSLASRVVVNSTVGGSALGSASSGLDIVITSVTPTICALSPTSSSVLVMLQSGDCRIKLNQPGDATWAAAAEVEVSTRVVDGLWLFTEYYTGPGCVETGSVNKSYIVANPSTTSCVGTSCQYYSNGMYRISRCIEGKEPTFPDGWLGYIYYSDSRCISSPSYRAIAPGGKCGALGYYGYTAQCTTNIVNWRSFSSKTCDSSPSSALIPRECGYTSGLGYTRALFPSNSSYCAEKYTQTISVYNLGEFNVVGSTIYSAIGYSSSGLDLNVTSLTPTICSYSSASKYLYFQAVGNCSLLVEQKGDADFFPASSAVASTMVTTSPWTVRRYFTSSTCTGTPTHVSASLSTSSTCISLTCRYYSSSMYYMDSCETTESPSLPANFIGYESFSSSTCAAGSSRSVLAWPSDTCAKVGSYSYHVRCIESKVLRDLYYNTGCSGTPNRVVSPLACTAQTAGFSPAAYCSGKKAQTINGTVAGTSSPGASIYWLSAIKASSGLAVSATVSGSTSVCSVSGGYIYISSSAGSGVCQVTFSQGGDDLYNAAPSEERSIVILAPIVQTIAPGSQSWQVTQTYTSSSCSTSSYVSMVAEKVTGCSSRTSCTYYLGTYRRVYCYSSEPAVPSGWVGYRSYSSVRGVTGTEEELEQEKLVRRSEGGRAITCSAASTQLVVAEPYDKCARLSTSTSVRSVCTSEGVTRKYYSGSGYCSGSAQTLTLSSTCTSTGLVGFCPNTAGGSTAWKVIAAGPSCGAASSGPATLVAEPDPQQSCVPASCECRTANSCAQTFCQNQSPMSQLPAGSNPDGFITLSSYSGSSSCQGDASSILFIAPGQCQTSGDRSYKLTCQNGAIVSEGFLNGDCSGEPSSGSNPTSQAGTCVPSSSTGTSSLVMCPRSSSTSVSGTSAGAVAGIVVGSIVGFMLLVGLIILIVFCCKRHRKDHYEDNVVGMTPMSARPDDVGPEAEARVLAQERAAGGGGVQYPGQAPPPYAVAVESARLQSPPPPYPGVYSPSSPVQYIADPSAPPMASVPGADASYIKPSAAYGIMRASEK